MYIVQCSGCLDMRMLRLKKRNERRTSDDLQQTLFARYKLLFILPSLPPPPFRACSDYPEFLLSSPQDYDFLFLPLTPG